MNESPPVFYRTSSPSGRLPKKQNLNKLEEMRQRDIEEGNRALDKMNESMDELETMLHKYQVPRFSRNPIKSKIDEIEIQIDQCTKSLKDRKIECVKRKSMIERDTKASKEDKSGDAKRRMNCAQK